MIHRSFNIIKNHTKSLHCIKPRVSQKQYSPKLINYTYHKSSITNNPLWFERDTELHGLYAMDLYTRLLKDRIVLLNGPVTPQSASEIVSQLLLLEAESSTDEIKMYINSPGGHVHDGLAIYDTMQLIKAPVSTICIGYACSMASLLLAAGEPGKRKALPHSFVMVHQPMSGTEGQASDIEIHAKHVLRLKSILNNLYHKHTNQPIDVIEKVLDRDTWWTSEEAKEWNIIDEVVAKRKENDSESESPQ